MHDIITFYTDGAYSSTKKSGGYAFYCPQYNLKVCGKESNTTNNRMELTAAIKSLEFIYNSKLSEKNIVIISDSKYLIETVNNNYSIKTNFDLWDELATLSQLLSHKNIIWKHVKGHSTNINNNIVDRLANYISQN